MPSPSPSSTASFSDAATTQSSPNLFSPLTLRRVTLRNRLAVSPMCMYSCIEGDGLATPWHMVHLGSRAVGGAAVVFTEATAVSAVGRISPHDLGIWSDAHGQALAPVVDFIKSQGALAGIQLAHAGRKASTYSPFLEQRGQVPATEGGWTPWAPSAIPFAAGDAAPHETTSAEISETVVDFVAAARRSVAAGFSVFELHAAHGYLLHQFLSPLSNSRRDDFGGSFENRTRLLREVTREVRKAIGDDLTLWVRLSATDWADEGGWTIDDSCTLAPLLKDDGADLIDCSSGGTLENATIPVGPLYQTPFATAIRATGIATGAVGMITTPQEANEIIEEGKADVVLLARAFLRDPYFVHTAARALQNKSPVPPQYTRGGLS